MTELDDIELLREFAEANSEAAFTALVARHINLVHSAAMRTVASAHAAEEVTQAVFIILARKARKLSVGTALSGWLYQTTRLTAANYLRGEFRRQRREQEAYMQSHLDEPDPAEWPQIAPLLEAAMGGLNEKDRNAIVLRFFENKTLGDVGHVLGASEDAAKMRVNRALEKLRKILSRRGVTTSAGVIAAMVSAHSVQAAPAGLAAGISAAAVHGSAVTASTWALIKGALKVMAWTKARSAAVAGVVLILAAGTTTWIVKTSSHHSPGQMQSNPATAEDFKNESIAHMTQAKQWALACIMFADDNQNQLPKNFDQLKRYAPELSASNWEIVSGGNMNSFNNPNQVSKTILLREMKSSQAPDGAYFKVYAFVDGHAELIRTADDDFEALEKQRGFLAHPAGR